MPKMFSLDIYWHILKFPFSRKKNDIENGHGAATPLKQLREPQTTTTLSPALHSKWETLPGSCPGRIQAAPDWWCHHREGEGRTPIRRWSHLEREPGRGVGHGHGGASGRVKLQDAAHLQTCPALPAPRRTRRTGRHREERGRSQQGHITSVMGIAQGQHPPSEAWRWSCTGGAFPLPCRRLPRLERNKKWFYYF